MFRKSQCGVVLLATFIAIIVAVAGGNLFTSQARAAGEPDDEIHSSYGDDSTQMWVYWHGPDASIQYGLTSAYNQSATAQAPAFTPVDITGPFWQVKLTGLTPGTTYHYQVGSSGLDHTFQTAPTGDMVWDDIGDTGSTYFNAASASGCNKTWMPQVWQQLASEQPNFVTHGGDITYANECGQPAVHQFWNDIQTLSTTTPIQFAWGNHEYGDVIDTSPPGTPRDSMANYKGRYNMANAQTVPNDKASQVANPGCPSPANPKVNGCQGDDWGSFVAGHVLFISYPEPWPNAYSDWQTKAGALMAQAETNPNIYFIVTYGHRPAYSSQTSNSVNTDLQAAVNNLGDLYSPTARPDGKYVLNVGHHVHGGEAFAPMHGIYNVTDGGGGSEEAGITKASSGSLWYTNHLEHLRTTVTGNKMTLNFICGPIFTPNPSKNACTQGSVLFSETLTGYQAQLNSQLSTTISDGATTANVGDQLTYTATATNSTAGTTANGAAMSVTLPANESVVDAGGGTVTGHVISWDLGYLPGNRTYTEQVIAHVDSGNPGDTLTATSQLQTSGTDCQNSGSNCSATDVDTIPQAKLTTTLTDGVATANAGDTLHYTLTTQNATGAPTASGVALNLVLPTNLTITDGGGGTVNGNTVSWPATDLAGGQSTTGTVTALVSNATPGTNFTATGTAQSTDGSCQANGSTCSASDTDSVPAQVQNVQYIANQSVEANLTGWTGTYNSDTTVSRITTDAYDGKASIQVVRKDSTAGVAGVISKPDSVSSTQAGTPYSGSVWVRSQQSGVSITFFLKEFDTAGNTVAIKNVVYTTPDTNWHQITNSYTAAKSGGTLRFGVYASNLTATGWFHMDMMSLASPQF